MTPDAPPVVWTIGHSTRSGNEFVALLKAHGIATVADVRTIPRSRRHPQFSSEALAAVLAREGIGYVHLPGLGGLRRPRLDSPNAGWRNEGFRGYADHLQTPEFAAALTELERLAAASRVTVMCAEAVPWRCHRSLLADALVASGVEVLHITGGSAPRRHVLTPFAHVEGGRVTYPASQPPLPLGRRPYAT